MEYDVGIWAYEDSVNAKEFDVRHAPQGSIDTLQRWKYLEFAFPEEEKRTQGFLAWRWHE